MEMFTIPAVLHLLEKICVTVFQNCLLSVTFLTSMLLKYFVLLLRKRLTQYYLVPPL